MSFIPKASAVAAPAALARVRWSSRRRGHDAASSRAGGEAGALWQWLKRRFESEEQRLERELRVKVRRRDAMERLLAREFERGARDRTEALRRALARHEASQGR
jgi:hypothetical protein